MGPHDRRTGRGHERPGRDRLGAAAGSRGWRTSGRRTQATFDLAARREQDPRPDRRAPLHHRVRQLPAAGRAADVAPQRAARRAATARRPRSHPRPREIMAQSGACTGHDGTERHPGRRACPPRLGEQGAAGADRVRPQVGPAALRGGDLLAGAGHRHGCGRRGRPGGVTAVGGQRPAAGRPGRAPGGRDVARGVLSQPPWRPDRVRGGGRADARRGDRGGGRTPQPARRAGSADRGHRRGRGAEGRRACTRSSAGRTAIASCPTAPSRPCSTCSAGAIRRRISPSCGRGSCGSATPAC